MANQISQATRRNIIQTIVREGIDWSGSLNDVEFLARVFDLESMPSHDGRYSNARGDIYQHTVNNDDWSDDWVFHDRRFDLYNCSDETFLRFLCEMIHPVVRPDSLEGEKILEMFNSELGPDGYQIHITISKFGKPKFEAVGILPSTIDALSQMKDVAEKIDSAYMQSQIVRMLSAVESDPDLAIGTSKEFIETVTKTILKEEGVELTGKEELPELVHLTLENVKPLEGITADPQTIRKTLGSLAFLVQTIGEIRNKDGTGHGHDASKAVADPRLALLAVNTASTIALFFYQSHEKKKP